MTEPFTTATVGEWLFDGFEDGILNWLEEIQGEIPPEIPIPEIPYGTKFGWFAERNESSTFDGRFGMYTGKKDLKKLGVLKSWKGMDELPYYRGECNKVKGTTGELWPPFDLNKEEDATMFISDVCRSLTLKRNGTLEKRGLKGFKWVGDDSLFDEGAKYPENICWCQAHEKECPALKTGLFNATKCQHGAPAFVSYPHFYLADKSYLDALTGLSPNKEDHELYISLEPSTGMPLEIRARLQINLFLRQDADLS